MEKGHLLVIFVLLLFFISGCESIRESPLFSMEISIKEIFKVGEEKIMDKPFDIQIDIKERFNFGEKVNFDYSILSENNIDIEYITLIDCIDAPEGMINRKKIYLEKGINYLEVHNDFRIDNTIESQTCNAIVEVLEPFKYHVKKSFKIETDPSFTSDVKICKDINCETKSKIFTLNEEVYIDYSINVENYNTLIELKDPEGITEEISLPYYFYPNKVGDYSLISNFDKEGYKSQIIMNHFSVIKEKPLIITKDILGITTIDKSVGNEKNLDLYAPGEAFIISNKDWKPIFKLNSVAGWSENSNKFNYPILVYYEGSDELSKIPSLSWYSFNSDLYLNQDNYLSLTIKDIKINGMSYYEWKEYFAYANIQMGINHQLNQNYLDIGELLSFSMELITKSEYNGFIVETVEIPSFNEDSFRLTSGSLIIDVNEEANNFLDIDESNFDVPVFEFFSPIVEGDDIDSIIRTIQSNNIIYINLIGNISESLVDTLVAEPNFGAGLESENIYSIEEEDFINYWSNLNTVVYSEENYTLGMLASAYSSLINAPLIFEGDIFDFTNYEVILIGDIFCPSGANCIKSFLSQEELMEEYYSVSGTDKAILVNNLDINHSLFDTYWSEKNPNPIFSTFGSSSLMAPYLSSIDDSLILPISLENVDVITDCNNFDDRIENIETVDDYIKGKMNVYSNLDYLTILSSPNSVPQSFNENCNSSSSWYYFKNSVDNVYGSSEDKIFTYNSYFDVVTDELGNTFSFYGVQNDKKFKMLFEKKDIQGNLISSGIFIEDYIYLYHFDVEIDQNGNFHIIYKASNNNGEFVIYYRIYSNNLLELLEESIIVSDASNVYGLNMYLDRNDDIHITYSQIDFGVWESDIHYLKISDNTVLFNEIFSVMGDSYFGKKIPVLYDGQGNNVLVVPDYEHGPSNGYVYHGFKKIIIDDSGSIQNELNFFEDKEIGEVFSFLNDQNKIVTISVCRYPYKICLTIDSSEYIIDNYLNDIEDVGYDGNIHLFSGHYAGDNYCVLNDDLTLNYCGNYPILLDNGWLLSVLDLKSVLLPNEKFMIVYNTIGYYYDNEFHSWYDVGFIDYLSYPHFSIGSYSSWTDPINAEGMIIDNSYYLKTGRIYGISSSDVSSYLSNIITNDRKIIINDNANLFGHSGDLGPSVQEGPALTTSHMNENEYSWNCITENLTYPCEPLINGSNPYSFNSSYFSEKSFLHYNDHGGPRLWWQVLISSDIPRLKNTLVMSQACSNSDFESGLSKTFGSNIMRMGGSGHFGASGVTWLESGYLPEDDIIYDYSYIIKNYLLNNPTSLGDLSIYLSDTFFQSFTIDYLLYGYPAYNLELTHGWNECGDGYIQSPNKYGIHEQCDDGNEINTDDCTNECKLATAHDGICWEGHERCGECCDSEGDCFVCNDCISYRGSVVNCGENEVCINYNVENPQNPKYVCAVDCSSTQDAFCFYQDCPRGFEDITGQGNPDDPLIYACYDLDHTQEAHYETWRCCEYIPPGEEDVPPRTVKPTQEIVPKKT